MFGYIIEWIDKKPLAMQLSNIFQCNKNNLQPIFEIQVFLNNFPLDYMRCHKNLGPIALAVLTFTEYCKHYKKPKHSLGPKNH